MTDQGVSLERLKERLEREPCAGAMHLLAETYYQQGQYPQAIAASRQALTLYPENLELRLILGQSLVSLGEYDEAEEILKPLVDAISHLGEAFHTLHLLYKGQGHAASAVQAEELYRLLQEGLEALLKGQKTLPQTGGDRRRSHLARTLEALKKWQRALQSH
jgi:tetratricopeptide (TPR) repeat protein